MELTRVKFEVGLDAAVLERASETHDVGLAVGVADIDFVGVDEVALPRDYVVQLLEVGQVLELALDFTLGVGLVVLFDLLELLLDDELLEHFEVVVDDHLDHVDSLVEDGRVLLDLISGDLVELAHILENVLHLFHFDC